MNDSTTLVAIIVPAITLLGVIVNYFIQKSKSSSVDSVAMRKELIKQLEDERLARKEERKEFETEKRRLEELVNKFRDEGFKCKIDMTTLQSEYKDALEKIDEFKEKFVKEGSRVVDNIKKTVEKLNDDTTK